MRIERNWLTTLACGLCAALLMPVAVVRAVSDDAADGDDAMAELGPPPGEGFPKGPPRDPELRPRHRGRPGAMLWLRMSEEERTELRAFVAEEYPEMYDRILEAEERNPERAHLHIARILPDMLEMKALRDRDPELFAIHRGEQRAEFELRRLARRYRFAASDEQRAALAKRIRPLVEKQFDARQRRMREEIERLEERIDKVRKRIARYDENREAQIEEMYQRILEGGPRGFRRGLDGEDDGGFEPHEPRRGRRGRGRGREASPPAEVSAVPEPKADKGE
jgi:hypothetical protein